MKGLPSPLRKQMKGLISNKPMDKEYLLPALLSATRKIVRKLSGITQWRMQTTERKRGKEKEQGRLADRTVDPYTSKAAWNEPTMILHLSTEDPER